MNAEEAGRLAARAGAVNVTLAGVGMVIEL